MVKLKIVKNNNYNYDLEYNGRIYRTNIEFYNLEFIPKVNDCMYMEEELLNEINNSVANFELLKKINNEINQKEIIIIIHDENKYYLKRVYG